MPQKPRLRAVVPAEIPRRRQEAIQTTRAYSTHNGPSLQEKLRLFAAGNAFLGRQEDVPLNCR